MQFVKPLLVVTKGLLADDPAGLRSCWGVAEGPLLVTHAWEAACATAGVQAHTHVDLRLWLTAQTDALAYAV